jgi:DNA-binding transcriptional regulator YdaS (Cro superfamily)
MALSRLVQQLEWLVKNVGWLEAHERIGVSKGTLSNWMNRRVRRVTPDNARKIVTAILVYREELRLQRGKEPSNKRINLAGT